MVINLEVELRDGETSERLVKRFIKKMRDTDILEEYRRHTVFTKKSDIRRKEKKDAEYRAKIEREKKER
jgi:ribosomal protein S21